jgi:hypothetical protein
VVHTVVTWGPVGAAADPSEEVAVATLEAPATLEGFTAGLAAGEARLWRMDSTNRWRRGGVVMVRSIMMAVGRITRTTGIPDHLVTGSTTIPTGMTKATPLMCNRHQVM